MLFGTECPKAVVGTTDWIIYNAIFEEYNYQLPVYLEQTSILNGVKTFNHLGDYSEFTIIAHAQKWVNPIEVFKNLYEALNGVVVDEFYPHFDATYPMLDKNGVPVKFFCESVSPFYLDNLTTYDGVMFKFKSQSYVDLKRTLEG